jgi:hypothetical protein
VTLNQLRSYQHRLLANDGGGGAYSNDLDVQEAGRYNLNYHLSHMSSKFQVGVREFRGMWQQKWTDLLDHMKDQQLRESQQKFPVFHLMLRLFAHQHVLRELAGSPHSEVDFYLPQICNFLLYGSSSEDQSIEIEEFLLKLARATPLTA